MEQSVYRLPFLDFASVMQTDNQLLICSVRFMQVELPPVRSCHTTVDGIGNEENWYLSLQ